jgi:hypothetical protein
MHLAQHLPSPFHPLLELRWARRHERNKVIHMTYSCALLRRNNISSPQLFKQSKFLRLKLLECLPLQVLSRREECRPMVAPFHRSAAAPLQARVAPRLQPTELKKRFEKMAAHQ